MDETLGQGPGSSAGSSGGQTLGAGAKEQAGRLAGQAKDKAFAQADAQVRRLSGRVDEIARTLDGLAGTMGERGMPAEWLNRAADFARRTGQQLEGKSTQELWSMAQREIRQRPALLIAGFAALGFIAGRLVRGGREVGDGHASLQY